MIEIEIRDFLVDNYGFCLDPGCNPFSSWKFRVIIGSKTPQTLSEVTELIPNEAHKADWSKVNDKTELMAVQSDRISEPLFEYLRSVLQGRYEADGGLDGEYLVVSSPRVIKYEIFVVTMALRLLDTVSEAELFHRSSLEENQAEMERVGPADWELIRSTKFEIQTFDTNLFNILIPVPLKELYTLLKLNVVTKKVYLGQKKTLQVLLAILQQLAEVESNDQTTFARVTYARVPALEDSDSDDEVFKRRMGLRHYFKQLYDSRLQVAASKKAKEERKKSRKDDNGGAKKGVKANKRKRK